MEVIYYLCYLTRIELLTGKRPLTTLEHMIEDYKRDMGEDDNTHFEDAIKLHDVSMDPGLEDPALLTERTANNFENRCVHHHIFNTPLVLKLVDYTGLKILKASLFTPLQHRCTSQENKRRQNR